MIQTIGAGLVDKAHPSPESFGVVVMVMLRQGRLLRLQFWTETAGTAKDLDALQPAAKKAIAAFRPSVPRKNLGQPLTRQS